MQKKESRHLDLGCGANPRNPYGRSKLYGIDVREDARDLLAKKNISMTKANLALEAIPYEDNFFDSISAVDFLEHIPRQIYFDREEKISYPFVDLMNEIWRVLVPGGRFLAITPGYPSRFAFSDPTHVNFISRSTHEYFCGDEPTGRIYGFKGRFAAHVAKFSAPSNYQTMPHNPAEAAIRDVIRRISGKGLHHLVWELEAIK